MAVKESYLNMLPLAIRTPIRKLLNSGASITNDIVGDLTGDMTGDVTGDRLNAAGYITHSSGSSVPTAATAGYAPGCIFILDGAVLGMSPMWMNHGTAASCLFYPFGPTMGYGFAWTSGPVDCVNGEVATEYTCGGNVRLTDICFASHAISNDNDQIIGIEAGASSVPGEENGVLVTADADPLTAHDYVFAGLRNKCTPEFDIFAAGYETSITADDATWDITLAGALASDIAFACFRDTDDTDVIAQAAMSAGHLIVTVSADPEVAHDLQYVVLRPRGSFAPSHYVAYAGQFTTVGGDAVEVATVAGVLATDIIMTNIEDHASGAVSLLKVLPTANTITWTYDQDPTASHLLSYAVIRAY